MSDRLLKESDVLREVESLLVSDETRHLNDLEYGNNQALYHVIDRIEDLPSADRPQEWIPCSEGLPKRQGFYICTCKDGSKYKRATVVKWSNGWQLTGARTYWVVVAWMPLPEPWKGADDE